MHSSGRSCALAFGLSVRCFLYFHAKLYAAFQDFDSRSIWTFYGSFGRTFHEAFFKTLSDSVRQSFSYSIQYAFFRA